MKFETIERIIKDIERMYPNTVKELSWKLVYVLTPEVDRSGHLETSFHDLNAIGMSHFCWMNPLGASENLSIHTIRKIKSGEFRGRLKATVPGTFVYELAIPAIEYTAFGEHFHTGWQKYPIIHNKHHSKPENAFTSLDLNKALSVFKEQPIYAQKMPEISKEIYHGLNAAFDMKYSWGICYEWNGMCFVFSMEHDEMKQILAERDLQGMGRRVVIPHVVKEHNRGNKHIPMHYRSGGANIPMVINGRSFSIMVDPGIIETAFDHKNGIKRLQKIREATKNDYK